MIAGNLRELIAKIKRKCTETGRDFNEIKLIVVSKNFWIDDINSAYNEGHRDFGENKVQELMAKYEILGNKINWHFIGHLQRNKVRFAIQAADYIHSVDSLQLASEINKRAEKIDKIQKVLIQVKTSEEETKFGVDDESEVFDLVAYCKQYKNLDLVGLMTIAPYTDDISEIRKSFIYLRELKERLNKNGYNLKELSMGMTGDFETAIEEGATMLRIGSAIFGQRDYSKSWQEK